MTNRALHKIHWSALPYISITIIIVSDTITNMLRRERDNMLNENSPWLISDSGS